MVVRARQRRGATEHLVSARLTEVERDMLRALQLDAADQHVSSTLRRLIVQAYEARPAGDDDGPEPLESSGGRTGG
jgi:hypothetical protein